MKEAIHFKLNDQAVELHVDPDRPLLWVLRTESSIRKALEG